MTEKSEINSVSKISAALNGSDGKAMQNMLKNKNDTKNKIVDNQHQQQNYIKTRWKQDENNTLMYERRYYNNDE